MSELISLLNQGLVITNYLAWNHIIHSWVDPLFLAACVWVAAKGTFRFIKWISEI